MADINFDLSNFNFTCDQIETLNELAYRLIYEYQPISDYVTLYGDINKCKEAGFIGDTSGLGVPCQGCNPTPQKFFINTEVLLWEPKCWEFYLTICYNEILGTIAQNSSLRKAYNMFDLTGTDYVQIILTLVLRELKRAVWRMIWFGDLQANHFGTGTGHITSSVDIQLMRVVDGLWKRIFTNTGITRVVITENDAATYAEQNELTPEQAYEYAKSIVNSASIELQGEGGRVLMTKKLYDKCREHLANFCCIESSYNNTVNGVSFVGYNGVPFVPVIEWDMLINLYENSGVNLYKPYRAIYTANGNLAAGMDDLNSFSLTDVWHSKDTRSVNIVGAGYISTLIFDPNLIVVGH